MHKFLASLTLLAGCAALQPAVIPPEQSLVGQWDNGAQMAVAPETLKRPPVAGGAYEWLDFQHARFFAVDLPNITSQQGKAIYLVWRTNGPNGPISRQRLWVFKSLPNGQLVMDFYAFKFPQLFESATFDDGRFKAIKRDDLTVYGPECALPVVQTSTGWSASIPSTCAITARSGRKMVLSANIIVDKDRLTYSEVGTLETGALAFKVPGGSAYEFVRLGER